MDHFKLIPPFLHNDMSIGKETTRNDFKGYLMDFLNVCIENLENNNYNTDELIIIVSDKKGNEYKYVIYKNLVDNNELLITRLYMYALKDRLLRVMLFNRKHFNKIVKLFQKEEELLNLYNYFKPDNYERSLMLYSRIVKFSMF